MKQQEVGAVAFAQFDPFEVEAREAIQLKGWGCLLVRMNHKF